MNDYSPETFENKNLPFTVNRLSPTIGGEILGIDLSQPIDSETKALVYEALLVYKVIFFRDQNISTEQHLNFSKNFGDLEIHPFAPKKEHLTIDTSRLSPHTQLYCQRWFTIGLWDFRLGHIVSFIIACIFLILAAIWMYPSSVEGQDVIGDIARIFTESVGNGLMIVFLIVEPHGLARLWSIAKEKLRRWPFPY